LNKYPVAPKVKTTLPNTRGRQEAQAKYNAKPEQKKRRAERNKARRIATKEGLVHKGDGKDVDHHNGNTADESARNLRVLPKSVNRHYNRRSSKTKAP
jgi:hypothetical protein